MAEPLQLSPYEAMTAIAVTMAKADSELHQAESAAIAKHLRSLVNEKAVSAQQLNAQVTKALLYMKQNGIAAMVKACAAALKTKEERSEAMKVALMLAFADGKLAPGERAYLNLLAGLLDFSPNDLEALVQFHQTLAEAGVSIA